MFCVDFSQPLIVIPLAVLVIAIVICCVKLRALLSNADIRKLRRAYMNKEQASFDFRPKVKSGEAFEFKGLMYFPEATIPIKSVEDLSLCKRIEGTYRFTSHPWATLDSGFRAWDQYIFVNRSGCEERWYILKATVQLQKASSGASVGDSKSVNFSFPKEEKVLTELKQQVESVLQGKAGDYWNDEFKRELQERQFVIGGLVFRVTECELL